MGRVEDDPVKEDDFPRKNQYIATICVSIGAVCAGTVLSWTSPVIPQIQIPQNLTEAENEEGLQLSETECGMVGSMLAVGALLSSLPAGFLADKFGRKYTLISLSIPFLLNWALIVFASSAELLYAGRFFGGLATGAICVCAPMYIGEIAHPSIRGKLGSFFQMFLCCGILLSYTIGAIVDWRMLSIILGCFPILFAICMWMMPETPAYLLKTGQDASISLQYFQGNSNQESLLQETTMEQKESGILDLVRSKANRKALIAAVGIMIFQQLSGINAVIFYSESIFQAAGTSLPSEIATILVGVLQLASAYLAAMLTEKANRKFFLLLSAIGMAICLSMLALYFHLKILNIESSILNLFPIASLLLYIVSFAFGFGPIPWMVMSELFAPEIKGIASGLAVLTNWAMVFVVTLAFPVLNTSLGGHVTFYIFTGFMCLAVLFVLKCIPETRGKTLDEIQYILSK